MSETDSFVEEVSEELRRDRLFRLFRRYGPYAIAALVILVGASAWNEWRKAERLAAMAEAGDALRAALAMTDPAARAEALAPLSAPGAAAPLVAALLEAQARAQAGDAARAKAILEGIAATPDTDPVYRDAARLRLVALGLAGTTPAERVALLDPLTGPDAPFRLLALEQRAVARIEQGETEAARGDLGAILADPLTTQALRARAQGLIEAIGGLSPAAPLQ